MIKFTISYVLGIFLVGLGYISMTPMFEGFDEIAHLSSIHEVAALQIPKNGESGIDSQIFYYGGPTQLTSGSPPYDKSRSSHTKFYDNDALVKEYIDKYRLGKFASEFNPTDKNLGLNWEAQHPPLYYLIMAPLSSMLRSLTAIKYIFFLRLASFSMFIIALIISIKVLYQFSEYKSFGLLGFASYPIFIPMVFPEFTRIGNDSLCVLITSIASYFIIKIVHNKDGIKSSFFLGLTLGLGLLTKAFFLPITVAIVFFLLLRSIYLKKDYKYAFITLFSSVILGGWWYLRNYFLYGVFTGSIELISLKNSGGLVYGLAKNYTNIEAMRGILVPLVSFIWAGTGSLVRSPLIFYFPILASNFIFAIFYLRYLFHNRALVNVESLGLWLFTSVYFGLLIHTINSLALYGRGTTPGWYMSILLPWIAPSMGIGISNLIRAIRNGYRLVFICALLSLIFHIVGIFTLIAIFTGMGFKGYNKFVNYSNSFFSINSLEIIIKRLDIISIIPSYITIILLVMGLSILFYIFIINLKKNVNENIYNNSCV